MILGYLITLPDIKCDMFGNLQLEECSKYSNIYDLNTIDTKFIMKNKKYNISCTYDGFIIVTDKFKRFCESERYTGLEFIVLPKESDFYWFKVHNVLEYDTKKRETEFINYNSICNGFEEIIGATPVCLKNSKPLSDDFFRTDVCFGSYAGKSPLCLVGELTKNKLEATGFKEIFFEKILDKYDWQKRIN